MNIFFLPERRNCERREWSWWGSPPFPKLKYAVTQGAVWTRQDKTHFKPITAAKCSLNCAWQGHRDLLPPCANYTILLVPGLRAAGERGLLSQDKIQHSPLLMASTKPGKPASGARSMDLLAFSKNMPRKLEASKEKCSSGNFRRGNRVLLHLLLLLCFLHSLNILLRIEGKLMICTSKENFPCDGW